MSTDLRELLRPRVERGATLLDSVEPYWFKRVEEELSLESCTHCVLGQVFGDYGDGLDELTARVEEWDWGSNGGSHGFGAVSDIPNTDEYWATLDALWREAIAERRLS